MKKIKVILVAGVALLPFVTTDVALAQKAATKVAAQNINQSAALKQLFADSDEANLKINPLSALFRGDMRYADQFGDYLSDNYLNAQRQNAMSDLARLKTIDRSALNPTDQIAYDVFKYQTEQNLLLLSAPLDRVQQQLPIDQFNGAHVFFPQISSGQSAAPYKTVKDYEDGLKRIDGFVKFLYDSVARMREGIAAGHVQPKIVMTRVSEQLGDLAKTPLDANPFYLPIKNMSADVTGADKDRLTKAYQDAINTKINPAYTQLKKFIDTEYMPKTRDVPGLISMKDGPALYSALIQQHTTTTMSPDEIHNLGLSEVARITAGMEAIKKQVGFKGNLKEFFDFLRKDPKFKFKTKQEMLDHYNAINAKVDQSIPKLFSTTPKSPFRIDPVPEYQEKSAAGGSYQQGTPDGSRPGIFYLNTYDLPSRSWVGSETLFLHEAIPGHHFQISLAQENTELPAFQRFGGNTAFVEGWALYAESLGQELGMFTDPYQLYGHYDDEMLRAMRLVVDTGIHAKGWSRERAIQYMLDNSAMSENDARAEVERYIAYPGQALSYKIGALTIRRLRTEAEKELGPKFDVRAFHAQVLTTGALPMSVLESKIRAWIKAEKNKA